MKLNFYWFSEPGVYQTVFHLTHGIRYSNFGSSSHVPGAHYDEPAMQPALQLRELPRYYHTILGKLQN